MKPEKERDVVPWRIGAWTGRLLAAVAFVVLVIGIGGEPVAAQDVSPAPILQWFEASDATIQARTPDLFMAGYGSVWLPPPGRADSGDQSVGYDVYDRFDLGSPGHPTLYGTETGLKRVGRIFDKAGVNLHVDLVINHNGFSNSGSVDGDGHSFVNAGGYPGFLLHNPPFTAANPYGTPGTDGDFNSAFDYSTIRQRLAGLIDIDYGTDWEYIRNPVDPNDSDNLPAGAQEAFGRLANVPDPANRRFYPDRDLAPITINDPATGQSNITVYPFNLSDPMAGDATAENVTGMMMRYAQWMVQVVGVDGFRIDAAKHVQGFAFNYLDRALFRANPRTRLDGSTQPVFSYSEVFDGNKNYLQGFVRKDIDPNDPTTVGGDRDVLDFPLYFAMKGNLTDNGIQNDWGNVVNAGMDFHDDTLLNGSQGVKFVVNHDDGPPAMSNVAHAFILTRPGDAVVYFNGKEFGDNRDFPKTGRGDALGGVYGDAITTLVNIRNTHGRGNYIQRYLTKENYAFERDGSMLVMLDNRNDAGSSDPVQLNVDLPYGTHLVELTGNAVANGLPQVLTVEDVGVGGQTYVTAKFLYNGGHDKGYLIYGLATPQSDQGVQLSNVAQVLQGQTPQTQPGGPSLDYLNGTTRLTDLDVIKADQFDVTLATKKVFLLGDPSLRDHDADGDNALIKIDGGIDLNDNGYVDFTDPGSPGSGSSPTNVTYGFEQFTDIHNAGYFADGGNGAAGLYEQSIDATQLSEGTHFITVRAFRHRGDGGPAVFSDFKKVIYVDRLKPVSEVASFDPITSGANENRRVVAQSTDGTGDNIHIFFDLPAADTDAQILAMLGSASQGDQIDADLWTHDETGVTSGNHVVTLVTFEITGNFNVQRVTGLFTSTIFGAGLGDTTFNGTYSPDDINVFANVLGSGNTIFNAAADLNGDGLVTRLDLNLLGGRLADVNADHATLDAYHQLLSTVPEPTTGAILLLLLVIGASQRRRRSC